MRAGMAVGSAQYPSMHRMFCNAGIEFIFCFRSWEVLQYTG